MHRPNKVLASCAPLVPWWDQLKVISHLAERTTIKKQHATRFSASLPALRRGMHKMQVRCEYIRPCWSAKERPLLNASVPRVCTTDISEPVTFLSAMLLLLRWPVSGSYQGEIEPCQK
jgi:hypothetical protein